MDERRLIQARDYCSDYDEALSLSDLPVAAGSGCAVLKESQPLETEDFEFALWGGVMSTEMCAAEDVFYQGRILPLRPSVSSDAGNRSDSGSRSESMDRSSSWGFNSSRSSSSSSCRSDARASNTFYAHPSPKPQLGSQARYRTVGSSCRKSNGWGVLRLGLVKPPEIELQDLRQRRSMKKSNPAKEQTQKKKSLGLSRLSSFSCKCSAASEIVPSQNVFTRRNSQQTEAKEDRLIQKKEAADQRTFEWLKELSLADVSQA
ncbi:uncharacterized protein [Aristolochia californica]|uniref:uncharacterized protein n=1 Tax=Aristolochia californica TaxID=171875 RepID=UPI0035DA10D8